MTSHSKPPNTAQQFDTATLRAIDASINRATEGLRVVEDFVRFSLDDAHLSELAKSLRHDLANACAAWPVAELHAARETRCDVGTQIATDGEAHRSDAAGVCAASFQRVKQSLRSLEEFSKLARPNVAASLEAIRYRTYTLERCTTIAIDSRNRLELARLCVLVDGRASETEFTKLVGELIAAGTTVIQLRDKRLTDTELSARARLLVSLTHESHTLAIINDRPDIAAAVHADGVHLGQDDLCVKEARAIVGPRRLIGVSAHSIEQAREAVLDGANYLGVGPTFPSTTKTFDRFPGLELLRQVAEEISLPAFAIGGIDTENLVDALATGIGRVAVSGAVVRAAKPADAVGRLLQVIQSQVI